MYPDLFTQLSHFVMNQARPLIFGGDWDKVLFLPVIQQGARHHRQDDAGTL